MIFFRELFLIDNYLLMNFMYIGYGGNPSLLKALKGGTCYILLYKLLLVLDFWAEYCGFLIELNCLSYINFGAPLLLLKRLIMGSYIVRFDNRSLGLNYTHAIYSQLRVIIIDWSGGYRYYCINYCVKGCLYWFFWGYWRDSSFQLFILELLLVLLVSMSWWRGTIYHFEVRETIFGRNEASF